MCDVHASVCKDELCNTLWCLFNGSDTVKCTVITINQKRKKVHRCKDRCIVDHGERLEKVCHSCHSESSEITASALSTWNKNKTLDTYDCNNPD